MTAQILHLTPPDPERLAWFEMNDSGNAQRLAARSGGLLRWVDQGDECGYWIAFDGRRWSRKDGARAARQRAQDVAKSIRDEVSALSEQIKGGRLPKGMVEAVGAEKAGEMAKEKLGQLHAWAIKSGNSSQIRNMLTEARIELSVFEDEFDTDPYAFNCGNGTLRFVKVGQGREVRLDPHDPADFITRIAEVDYDPAAECPKWLARLERLQPEADQREMMRRIFGYALLGLRSEQVFITAQGKGGDGKSLTHVVISKIFGDYYKHASVKSFLKGGAKSGSDHSEDLARLAGDTRLVTADEPERFSTWNSEVIKQMTGGGHMTVRGLRESSKEVQPKWLAVVECNTFPKVPTSDDGFWRRTAILQWPVQLRRDQMGDFEEIRKELLAERAGILNWMIGGALAWLDERTLKPSARAEEVKESYRNASDPFGEWYRTRCVTGETDDPDLRERGRTLHEDFKEFCTEELGIDSAKVPGERAFGTQLDERQHLNRKSNGNKVRLGIRLKTASEMADGEPRGGVSGDVGVIEDMPGDDWS